MQEEILKPNRTRVRLINNYPDIVDIEEISSGLYRLRFREAF